MGGEGRQFSREKHFCGILEPAFRVIKWKGQQAFIEAARREKEALKNVCWSEGRASEANLVVEVWYPATVVPNMLSVHNDLIAKLGSPVLGGISGCLQSRTQMSEVILLGKCRLEIDPNLLPEYIINKGAPLGKAFYTAVESPISVLRLVDQLVKTRNSSNLTIACDGN